MAVVYEKDYEANCFVALNENNHYLGSIHLKDDGYSSKIFIEGDVELEVFKNDIRTVFEVVSAVIANSDNFIGGSTQIFDDSQSKVYLLHFDHDEVAVLTTFYKELYRWAHKYANLKRDTH